MGGLYGDLIYHHAAGSRKRIFFWGEVATESLGIKNIKINKTLQRLLFRYNRELIDWFMGKSSNGSKKLENADHLTIISSTKEMADCLIHGLELNKKQISIGWVDDSLKIAKIISQKKVKNNSLFISIYTYPIAFPATFSDHEKARENMILQWNSYYSTVVELHRKFHFAIVKLDIRNPDDAAVRVARLGIELGLNPNLRQIQVNIRDLVENIAENNVHQIPSMCRETFEYLEKNSLKNLSGDFAYEILQLKKELLEIEKKENTHA
jgi:hypothetical protein